jgi:hypothetical protein
MDIQTEFAALVMAVDDVEGVLIEGGPHRSARGRGVSLIWNVPVYDLTDRAALDELSGESYDGFRHDYDCIPHLPLAFAVAVTATEGNRTWYRMESSALNSRTASDPVHYIVRQYTLGNRSQTQDWWVTNIIGVLHQNCDVRCTTVSDAIAKMMLSTPAGEKFAKDKAIEMMRLAWVLPRLIYWLDIRQVPVVERPSSGLHEVISAYRVGTAQSPLPLIRVISLSAVKSVYLSRSSGGVGISQPPHDRKGHWRTYKMPLKSGPNAGADKIWIDSYAVKGGYKSAVIRKVVP